MEYALSALVGMSALIQGGFYPTNFLAFGVVLALLRFIFRKKSGTAPAELALWALSLFYIAASLAGGYDADSLSQACLPCVCAVFLRCFRALPAEKRARTLDWLVIGSGVAAGVGLLAFSGLVSIQGAVTARRLQFPFQYANAAGSWFAAVSLIAAGRGDGRARRMALPCLTALFLTRSVGALGLYAVMLAVLLWRRRKERSWAGAAALHALAAAFAAAFSLLDGWAAVPLLPALYAAGWFSEEYVFPMVEKYRLRWLCLALCVAGIAALALSGRLSSGLRTFAERLVMIGDGLALIAAHPFLGVGAGNWEAYYPYYQSAQYTSTVVHAGLIQIGADAGVLAMALAAAFFVLAFRGKGRELAESLAALLLAVHSLADFTLRFFPIDALLLALLFAGREERDDIVKLPAAVRLPALAACGLLCLTMLWCQLREKQLLRTAQEGNPAALAAACETQRSLLGGSRTVRDLYVSALYGMGDMERVVSETEAARPPTMDELIFRAEALRALGAEDEACSLLLGELGRQLYRVALFEETARLLTEWDADEAYVAEYDRLAALANDSQTILGVLKGDQVYIKSLK